MTPEPKSPMAMILCTGCGFHAERYEIIEHDTDAPIPADTCLRCQACERTPLLRESYRRGFNAGLDALKEAVCGVVENSNLRRSSPSG